MDGQVSHPGLESIKNESPVGIEKKRSALKEEIEDFIIQINH
jgi:hypothetical protein